MQRTRIQATEKLPAGEAKIEIESRLLDARLYSPLAVTIKVNGRIYAQGQVPKTAPAMFSLSDGFDIGSDFGSPVSEVYYDQAPFKFNGAIEKVQIEYLDTNN